MVNGAQAIAEALRRLGIDTIFGLPGTQNLELVEAFRQSPLQVIRGIDELSASFMANGYYRASGKQAVVFTIPGPGFTYALTGIAEAYADSVALIYLLVLPNPSTQSFSFHTLDHEALLSPIVKAVYHIRAATECWSVLREASARSLSGEPSPVAICVMESVLQAEAPPPPHNYTAITPSFPDGTSQFVELVERVATAKRPLIFAGQGALGASAKLRQLASLISCPVITTCSGRGAFSDTHPLAIRCDFSVGVTESVQRLFLSSDCVLTLGCKFTHNGTGGFELPLAAEKLVRVDTAAELLQTNYPAALAICAPVLTIINHLLAHEPAFTNRKQGWSLVEIEDFRQAIKRESLAKLALSPRIRRTRPSSVEAFFFELRSALNSHAYGDDCIVTTDAGLHQTLTRLHFDVTNPYTFVTPTDFQAMGFGIPAAIGALVGGGSSRAVAIVGDGGFRISATELITAAERGLNLVVIVFNDGYFTSIRRDQLTRYGAEYLVRLKPIDLEHFAKSVAIPHVVLQGKLKENLNRLVRMDGVVLAELNLSDPQGLKRLRLKSLFRNRLHSLLGHSNATKIKKLLKSRL